MGTTKLFEITKIPENIFEGVTHFMNCYRKYCASFLRILKSNTPRHDFVNIFHIKFLGRCAAIGVIFSEYDLKAQKIFMKNSLLYGEIHFTEHGDRDALVNIMISRNRWVHVIMDDLIAFWLEALIESVKECDPGCDRSVEASWRKVMAPGIQVIQRKYRKHIFREVGTRKTICLP